MLQPPTLLNFINGDGRVTLSWKASPDQAMDDFQGYSVYRDTTSMEGLAPIDMGGKRLNPAPPTTVGTVTTYTDPTAVNGVRYFYRLIGVKGGTFNEFSSGLEIETAARPEAIGDTLFEIGLGSRPCGIRLRDGRAFFMDSLSLATGACADSIDLYLGTVAARDAVWNYGTRDTTLHNLSIKSPHLVSSDGHLAPDWGARQTEILSLGLLDAGWNLNTFNPQAVWSDRFDLGADSTDGEVLAIRTPAADSLFHYAKVQVLDHQGDGGERSVILRIAYQLRENYARF